MRKFLFGLALGLIGIAGITSAQYLESWAPNGNNYLKPLPSSIRSILLPAGSTTNRPATPTNGVIRYNTTLNAFEGYVNSAWASFFTGTPFTNPMSTLGDIIYGAASGTATRLGGNTTSTPMALLSTGSGSAATAPSWTEITQSIINGLKTTDSPTFAGATIGSLSGVIKAAAGALSGSATTADLPDSLNKRYVTDAQLSSIGTTFSNPMTTLGDLIYGKASGNVERLAGNTTTTPKALLSTGSGSLATTPAWTEITQSIVNGLKTTDSPSFTGMTIGSLSGVLKASTGVVGGSATTADLPDSLNKRYVTDANLTSIGTIEGKQIFHGVQASGALSFNDTSHALTMASGTNTYWYKGARYTTASAITADIDVCSSLANNTLYYFYFSDATGAMTCSTSVWSFTNNVFVATVFWNGSAGAIQQETHAYDRDISWHIWAHDTIGERYESGSTLVTPTTGTPAALDILTGVYHDEDLDFATGAETTMRGWHKVNSTTYTFTGYATPYVGTAGQPQYLDTDTYTLTNVGATDYVNMWVYVANDPTLNIYVIPTERATAYNNLADARAATTPTTIGLNINPELKLIYKFIYKGDGSFIESVDYRTSSPIPGGGFSTVSASSVSFAPYGTIAATNVQAALQELSDEKQANLTFGIADTNSLRVDDASAADNDYAKFTATGIEGVPYATVLSDIGAQATVTWGAGLNATGATARTDSTEQDFLTSGTTCTNAAAGAQCIDTTDDQLLYYGGATRVLPYTYTKCRSKIDMASTDDSISIGNVNDATTVTGVSCSYLGTGSTPATVALKDGAGNAMTHNTVTCAAQSSAVTWVAVTANNALTAGETVMFDTTNTPDPATDDYVVCISYTFDRQ